MHKIPVKRALISVLLLCSFILFGIGINYSFDKYVHDHIMKNSFEVVEGLEIEIVETPSVTWFSELQATPRTTPVMYEFGFRDDGTMTWREVPYATVD